MNISNYIIYPCSFILPYQTDFLRYPCIHCFHTDHAWSIVVSSLLLRSSPVRTLNYSNIPDLLFTLLSFSFSHYVEIKCTSATDINDLILYERLSYLYDHYRKGKTRRDVVSNIDISSIYTETNCQLFFSPFHSNKKSNDYTFALSCFTNTRLWSLYFIHADDTLQIFSICICVYVQLHVYRSWMIKQ